MSNHNNNIINYFARGLVKYEKKKSDIESDHEFIILSI